MYSSYVFLVYFFTRNVKVTGIQESRFNRINDFYCSLRKFLIETGFPLSLSLCLSLLPCRYIVMSLGQCLACAEVVSVLSTITFELQVQMSTQYFSMKIIDSLKLFSTYWYSNILIILHIIYR